MRSIDLHWLSKKEKDITLPNLLYTEVEDCGACYYPNKFFGNEVLINNKYYDCSNGLIVVNTNELYGDKNEVENALAHEWRHHCQFLRNIYLENKIRYNFNDSETYDENIVNYFLNDPTEMDALLFSLKVAPVEHCLEWQELIKNRSKI